MGPSIQGARDAPSTWLLLLQSCRHKLVKPTQCSWLPWPLQESYDGKVQRAVAGALRTLAFKNEDNKNQIVECRALSTLIHMLRAEDSLIHYEAVGVIGNLVHSSQVRTSHVL